MAVKSLSCLGKWSAFELLNVKSVIILYYTNTTWAVGIAQLTHQMVRVEAKSPETESRWIFAPNADRAVSQLGNTDRPCRCAFIPHSICVISLILFKA